ncbi:MAG: hypothetical protein AABW73_04705 [Nanoarchaeota archaeon]
MNKIDKAFYDALRYFASHESLEIMDTLSDKTKKEKFMKKMSDAMFTTLQSHGYVTFSQPAHYLLTTKGMTYLRTLEDERRKDLTLIWAVVAVVISIVALVVSIIS